MTKKAKKDTLLGLVALIIGILTSLGFSSVNYYNQGSTDKQVEVNTKDQNHLRELVEATLIISNRNNAILEHLKDEK